ncbi:MAG: hypothetical protein ACU0GG_08230 [Paracoccaceae bacterium]
MSGLIIDNMLPSTFLRMQGAYVQTCAHVEMLLWRIARHFAALDIQNDDKLSEAFQLRKSNQALLKELKRLLPEMPETVTQKLSPILTQIDAEIRFRHMAVHGAWLHKSGGKFACEYYWNEGTRTNPDWKHLDGVVTLQEIKSALLTANDLLSRVGEIWMTDCQKTK